MEQKPDKEKSVNNAFDLVRYTWGKKWILIALSSFAFVASIIFSLLISPRFKAEVVLFPASSVSIPKALIETSTFNTDGRDILSFGQDEEAERLLQILHSNQIRDHIARKFDLRAHYKIKLSEPFPKTKLENKYKSNIKFKRTKFKSIEINVLDTDPQMAADIANEIAAYVDSTIINMQRERATEAFNIVEHEYVNSQHEIKLLNDSLKKIRRPGDLETYSELSQRLESEIERMGQLKIKYISSKINLEQILPHLFIVDKAIKAERKAVPKRSIIVIISTLSAFALSLLLLLINDRIKSEN